MQLDIQGHGGQTEGNLSETFPPSAMWVLRTELSYWSQQQHYSEPSH